MPRPIISLAAISAASLLLAACGSSSSSSSGSTSTPATATQAAAAAPASAVVVRTASNAKLGTTILVNSSGMTLYHLSGEGNGKFICTPQACLAVWHPLTVAAGTSPSGTSALGSVKRPDGSRQVTYNGEPLYTFAPDAKPGETNGQNLKDVGTWTVVTVGSSSASGTSSSPSTTTTTRGYGGY